MQWMSAIRCCISLTVNKKSADRPHAPENRATTTTNAHGQYIQIIRINPNNKWRRYFEYE